MPNFNGKYSVGVGYTKTGNFNITTLGNPNRLLLFAGLTRYGSGNWTAACDSVPMTEIAACKGAGYSMFYLVAPAVGTPLVSFTCDQYISGAVAALCYDAVDQLSPIGSGNNGDLGSTLASQLGRLVADFFLLVDTNSGGPGTITPGAGQTSRENNIINLGSNYYCAAGMSDIPGATSVSPSWSHNAGWPSHVQRELSVDLKPYIEARGRRSRYEINLLDPYLTISDRGVPVDPWDCETDEWYTIVGANLPGVARSSSFLTESIRFYGEGLTYDDRAGTLRLQNDRSQFIEVILPNAAGRSTF